MTIEIKPVGIRCNLDCRYCYQQSMRIRGNFGSCLDIEKLVPILKQIPERTPILIFGGEPLLLKKKDLESLFTNLEKKGSSISIQTNGSLIDKNHLELFRKYNVHVGFSIDGPDELNDARWTRSRKETRLTTKKSIDNFYLLLEEEIQVGLIVTLHKINAGNMKRVTKLISWFSEIAEYGLESIRLHILEADNKYTKTKLLIEKKRLVTILKKIYQVSQIDFPNITFDIFSDIKKLLIGEDEHVTCVWNACDPWTTNSVQGIEGDGGLSNCGRTNKEGVNWLKTRQTNYSRYIALYQTPREFGGCKDCKYWLCCKGQCPGSSIDGDFRNRSDYCEVWYELFNYFEREYLDSGIVPITKSELLSKLEQVFLNSWMNNKSMSIKIALNKPSKNMRIWHVPVKK